MDISKLIAVLVLAILTACTDPATAPAATPSASATKNSTANSCPDSAQQFWTKFRAAVLQDDFDAVAAMTFFPLEVKGDADDNPTKFIYRKNFNKHFTTLLSHELDGDHESIRPRPASMKELVRAVTKLSKCGGNGSQFSLGSLGFLLKPEGWRFDIVYSNDFIVAETEEPLHVTPIETLQSAPKGK